MYRNIAGLGRDSTLKTVPGLGGSLAIDTRPGSIKLGARIFIRNAGVLDAELQTPVDLGKILAGADPATLPVRASVNIPRFRLASLADFTDGFKGVQGELYGRIDLSGSAQRPSGHAHLAVDGAQVDKVQFRQVKVDAEGDQGRLAAHLDMQQTTGGRLDGSLTVERAHDDRLRATLTGKDLDIGFLRLFLTNVRELAGVAQLSVTAEGSVASPRVRASLSVDKGRVGVTGQPTFQDVRANATLEPGRADLHSFAMRSGGGTLDGKGWALLGGPSGMSPRSTVFTAHAHRFLVAAAGSTGARIDGDLAVNAALREDVLTGKVEIPDANVWLPKGPPTGSGRDLQKIGAHPDVHFVDQTALAAAERDREKKREAAASALRLAVTATAKPVYIRGKDLDSRCGATSRSGRCRAARTRARRPCQEEFTSRAGRINIQGQRFDFEHGNVTFNGSYEINPELDLKLTRQYPEALVVIELRGTPKKPQLRMSSDPAVYDQAQIVSLILTGQPGGQPSTGKSFDPTAAVATAVLSKLADKVAPALGLDVMRVEGQEVKNEKGEATGDTDTRVEVGKYVTERIYLSYAHIFGAPDNANQNEAHVEYRMTRRLMMETVFGDAGQGGTRHPLDVSLLERPAGGHQWRTSLGRGPMRVRARRAASRQNASASIGFGRKASMPVGRFDSDMSTELIKMTGISRRVRLFHRRRQNTQPSMTGIIRSSRMNAGAVGNVARSPSASSPCRAPTVANPASSRRSQRASLIASSSSTTRTRGHFGSTSEVASVLSASLMTPLLPRRRDRHGD